jgi:hypothetical protein
VLLGGSLRPLGSSVFFSILSRDVWALNTFDCLISKGGGRRADQRELKHEKNSASAVSLRRATSKPGKCRYF